jgi:putative RecB family exonuclease
MSAEYSISQLKKFEECPRQYKFIYVDRIRREEEGVEAFMGQRFHDAMEWLYGERAFRVAPLEELLDRYEKDWAAQWHPAVRIVREGRTQDDYRALGRRFIEDYYRRHHPFDEGKVAGLERRIHFPLDEAGRYRCKGIIDRLMIAPDGAFEVHDYKTTSKLPEQREIDEDRQLALYQIGVQALWPEARERGVRLVWHEVAFDVEMRSTRTPESLDRLRAGLGALIDRIEAETEFPLHESALCSWCAYPDLCPARKNLVKLEGLPKDRWKDEPGVAIADAYAEKWRKKRELDTQVEAIEEELGALKEAAVAFAEKEGLQAIAGFGATLRVKGREHLVTPKKGTAERDALESELRAAGVWDKLSTLDPKSFEKALEAGEWGAEIAERIRRYVSTEKRWTVRLRDESPDE